MGNMLLVGQYFKLKEKLQDYLGLETGHRDYPIYDMREYYWNTISDCSIECAEDKNFKEGYRTFDFSTITETDHYTVAIETMYSEWGVFILDSDKKVEE